MGSVSVRRIGKSGGSYMVSIPPEIVYELGLNVGDYVSMFIGLDGNHIIVQLVLRKGSKRCGLSVAVEALGEIASSYPSPGSQPALCGDASVSQPALCGEVDPTASPCGLSR